MVKLFSKSLQGIKGGGAPFCAALRAALCAMRSRKRPCQPKTAKRFFGGPGSHGPSGQAKERTRVLPVRRGFSAPGVPRRLPGRPFLCRLPLLWWILCPVPGVFSAGVSLPCSRPAAVRRFLFGLRCLLAVWPSSALFPACRQPAAFVPGPRRRGLLAICPPCALCARLFSLVFSLSCLTFASQKSFHLSLRPRRASTFFRKESRQRFARGRGSAPFEPPFLRPAANLFLFRAAGRLSGPSGRKPPADRETLEKPRSRAQLFKRFCAKGDACALWLISPFLSLLAGLSGPLGRKPPAGGGNARKAKGAKLSFSGVSVRGGCAGAFARRVSSRLQGTGARISVCLGEQKLSAGLNPESSRVCVRLGKATNPVRVLPAAGAGFLPARENRSSVRACTPKAAACVRDVGKKKTGSANCPPQVCANCSARAFCLPGKTEAVRGPAPATNRVRARLGKETNPERDLLTAGARACAAGCRHKPGTRIARRSRGFPSGRREQGPGFRSAWENKSSARAHTRKQPRACEAGRRHKPGARLARRSRGFPSGRREQGPGFRSAWENKSSARAHTRKQPRACEAGRRHKPGARFAHRRRKSSAKLCGKRLDNSDKLYYNK